MARPDQRADLGLDLGLAELAARNRAVLGVVRTVNAAVDAIIGQIQRSEKDDAVAVELLFDLGSQGIDLLFQGRVVAVHEDGCLTVRQALAAGGLFQDLEHPLRVFAFALGLGEAFEHFRMVDEFLGVR